jgi:uncharacterized Rossmann fold enzyme
VEYRDWEPVYARIQEEFGFPFDRERMSADRLVAIRGDRLPEAPLRLLEPLLRGRTAVVCGRAPGAGPPPLWRLPVSESSVALVAADGAAADCLAAALIPAIVVTDLDGPVASEVTANRRGSRVVLHAHGDNLPSIEEWADQFPGVVLGSWAGPPRARLFNVGGFTDGDRAALLSEHLGARRILLWGFDFHHVDEPDEGRRRRKLAKLAWAEQILRAMARRRNTAVDLWRPDGSIVPYPVGADTATR